LGRYLPIVGYELVLSLLLIHVMNPSQASRFYLPILFVIQMDVFDLVNAEPLLGEHPFKQNLLHLHFGIILQATNKIHALTCPFGKLQVVMVCLVNDQHATPSGHLWATFLPFV